MNKEKHSFKRYVVKLLFKNQKIIRIKAFFLVLTAFCIFAFQNCNKDNSNSLERAASLPNPINTPTTLSTTNSSGDKAIFRTYETENKTISNIFWRVIEKNSPACGDDKIINTGTAMSVEIDWNTLLEKLIAVEAFIQFEGDSCISYRKQKFNLDVDGLTLGVICDYIYRSEITSQLSSDSQVKHKRHFPIDSSIDLGFKTVGGMGTSPEFDSFQWSIKKIAFLSDSATSVELADQANTSSKTLTHTFSEIGLYNIVVEASGPDSASDQDNEPESSSASKELLIGKCEEDEDATAVDIILSNASFGDETPEALSQVGPLWNYVRPANTDSNNPPSMVILSSDDYRSDDYRYDKKIYKYKRTIDSKFIDIDIQNADECFLDQEPQSEEICREIGCLDKSDCNTCSTSYTMRESLSPLSSCSGNALDMSTLDTDTTECTDDVFVVAASKTDQDKVQRAFYKHCPADQNYCYFGSESNRPTDHNCP